MSQQKISTLELLKNYKEVSQTTNPEIKNLILDLERGLAEAPLSNEERVAINLLYLTDPFEYPTRQEYGRPLGGVTQSHVAQMVIEEDRSDNAKNIRLGRIIKKASEKIAATLGEPYE